MKIFKAIQDTFSKIVEIVLSNKYLKALFLTLLLIDSLLLVILFLLLIKIYPIIGGVAISVIIYLIILNDLR